MRVIVCGGRKYTNATHLRGTLDRAGVDHLICGGARGADTLALLWALDKGVFFTVFPADWDQFGQENAGRRRNKQMLFSGLPDCVIAFPGGSGTLSMVRLAHAAEVPVFDATTCREEWYV